MAANRIFGYAASEALRQRLDSLAPSLLTDRPPWEHAIGERGPYDLAFVEVTQDSFPVSSTWLTALRTRSPGARILPLAAPDLTDEQKDLLASRTTEVLATDLPPERLRELAQQTPPAPRRPLGIKLEGEELREFNRVAMEAASQSFFLIQDGIILSATIPAYDTHGWTVEELVGRHFLEFLHPSSRDRVARTYVARMSGQDAPQRYEAQALGPDGETFPVELIVKRIRFRGRPAAVGTLSEITERHAWLSIQDRRERELSLVNEVTHILISGRRLENSMIRALESILDALDADAGSVFTASSPPRRGFEPLVTRRRTQGRSSPWKQCRDQGKIKLQKEMLARLRSGSTVGGSPCPALDEMGDVQICAPLITKKKLAGFMLIVRQRGEPFDEEEASLLGSIAASVAMGLENRRLYEDLQASYEELVGTQKELLRRERLAVIGNMAAHVAHEIRNPVATIMNAAGQIRKRTRFSGIEEELADIIEEELQRLRRLCDDLVMFSRTPQPAPQSLLIGEFIQSILGDLSRAQFITDSVQTVVQVNPPDLEVQQDPDILNQLLRNLVFNALQSMGSEGRLELHCRQDRQHLYVQVKDSGPGIPPEIIDRIFDPFFSTRPESAGLGLAIVRNYVEELGGELRVTSGQTEGTTIHLRLSAEHPSQPPAEDL